MTGYIILPEDAYWQPGEHESIDNNGISSLVKSIKGPYRALKDLLRSLRIGDEVLEGYCLTSADLIRNPGDVGTINLHISPKEPDDTGSEQTALEETWTVKSVRNDMSILAYCGPSEGNDPQRALIEMWQKEPDGELASAFKYTKPDGTIGELTGKSLDVAAKIARGIDSVMRFYPLLTRTRTYANIPRDVMQKLSYIDAPPVGSTAAKKVNRPTNLASLVLGYNWLKCQDDNTQASNGTWQRIESWIGVNKAEGGRWDGNLYGDGDERWTFPSK